MRALRSASSAWSHGRSDCAIRCTVPRTVHVRTSPAARIEDRVSPGTRERRASTEARRSWAWTPITARAASSTVAHTVAGVSRCAAKRARRKRSSASIQRMLTGSSPAHRAAAPWRDKPAADPTTKHRAFRHSETVWPRLQDAPRDTDAGPAGPACRLVTCCCSRRLCWLGLLAPCICWGLTWRTCHRRGRRRQAGDARTTYDRNDRSRPPSDANVNGAARGKAACARRRSCARRWPRPRGWQAS
jgi:hypothetical protein